MNAGHGWVRPLPMGVTANCGGPDKCNECAIELTDLRIAVMQLYNWQVYGGDNFHSILFHLISKGSGGNRERLGQGFPWELVAWRQWQEAPEPWAFFEKFGLKRPGVLSPRPGPYDRQESEKQN